MNNKYDAVSLGMMWDRLTSICDEIVSALVRSSFSPMVKEQGDLTCCVFDSNGNLLSQGTFCQPAFIGTAPLTMRHMLKEFPVETLEPGDMLITNNPWLGTGHLFDVNVMSPIFRGSKIVGFTLSVTHVPDIGGAGYGTSGTEIYEEGLQIPIMKLTERGRPNEHLFRIIRTNVRTPEMTCGDLMAHITCNEVGGRLLLEMMSDYQIDDLTSISSQIFEHTERAMRDEILIIPDGVYKHAFPVEGIDGPITLACAATVKGDSISFDYSGTSPMVRRGINVPLCYTRAFSLYAMKCLTIPSLPNNEGAAAPISVSAPAGCILNGIPPYPTGARQVIGHYVPSLIFGALKDALPKRVQSDSGMPTQIYVQGYRRDGQRFSGLFLSSSGYGALDSFDGHPAMPFPHNMFTCAAEVWETETNMRIMSKALRVDSGGPGEFRGGAGQEILLRNDTNHPMVIFCMSGRNEFPANGFNGGKPGALRRFILNDKDINPKGRYEPNPGDTLLILEAGGGGFGDVRNRRPELVKRDIEAGFVSIDGALEDYGVSLSSISSVGSDLKKSNRLTHD